MNTSPSTPSDFPTAEERMWKDPYEEYRLPEKAVRFELRGFPLLRVIRDTSVAFGSTYDVRQPTAVYVITDGAWVGICAYEVNYYNDHSEHSMYKARVIPARGVEWPSSNYTQRVTIGDVGLCTRCGYRDLLEATADIDGTPVALPDWLSDLIFYDMDDLQAAADKGPLEVDSVYLENVEEADDWIIEGWTSEALMDHLEADHLQFKIDRNHSRYDVQRLQQHHNDLHAGRVGLRPHVESGPHNVQPDWDAMPLFECDDCHDPMG